MEIEATAREAVDVSSIERLFRESSDGLWRALYAYSGGRREIADEATAEAFARAIRHAGSIRRPLPWIYTTAFRIAAQEMRRERRQHPVEGSAEVPSVGELDEVLAALRSLPPRQRAVAILHYEVDLPVREVARRLGISAATVKVHLHRARLRLRAVLGEEEGRDD